MKRVHFIGIGGIGLSALARFLKEQDYIVSGSDLKESKITKELAQNNIKIFIGHDEKHIKDANIIIYSAAIKKDNKEFQAAIKSKAKCLSRKEALPLILKDKKILSIAGAHGKSTTSSILASLIDASVIIGAILKKQACNMLYKNSDKIIFEADESDSSFLNSNPYLAIVTNVDKEHLEHYEGNYCLLQNAYFEFLKQAKYRVINAEDEYLGSLSLEANRLYPSKDIKNISYELDNYKPYLSFDFKDYGRFKLQAIGEHNAINASLAIMAASYYQDMELIKKRLLAYEGIKKRFDILYADEKMALIDDYAHHPKEIKASLKAARLYQKLANYKSLAIIFQPHKYSRFIALKADFVEVLKEVEELYILPVYAASEEKQDINMKALFPKAKFIKELKREENHLILDNKYILNQGLIIGFGAGDITYMLRK